MLDTFSLAMQGEVLILDVDNFSIFLGCLIPGSAG